MTTADDQAPENALSCDVLIVGGGPAGLSVAAVLPEGVKSLLIHQDREIGLPVRTSGGCFLADVQRLNIPPHLYNQMTRVGIYADTCEAHFELERHPAVTLDVTGLYRWIAAKSQGKTQILTGTKFLDAKPNGAGWTVTTRTRDKQTQQIRTRYIVDASGHPCAVISKLGLVPQPERTATGYEHEYPIGPNDPHRGVLFMGRDALTGYGWMFPTADGRLRVGVGVIKPVSEASPRDLLEGFLASERFKRMGVTLDGPPLAVNAGTLPSIPYDRKLVFDTVIRVGDSANFATPTLGEGIRICMEQGEILGRALGETLKTGSPRPLKRYERHCARRMARNYWLGFLANQRGATYTPEDWDRSVARMARLSEDQLIAFLRSEFTLSLALKSLWRSARRRTRALLNR
jgi:flavin-dependent dehydrogenase